MTASHYGNAVIVAVAEANSIRVGIDLVAAEAVTPSVQRMWFTWREQQRAARSPLTAARIWAAKEAAYKALQQGEPFFPQHIEAVPETDVRLACDYRAVSRCVSVVADTWTAPGSLVVGYVQADAACI
jgi:phosphopantetheinyl transferase